MNIAPDILFAIAALVAVSAIVVIALLVSFKRGSGSSEPNPAVSEEYRKKLEEEKRARESLAKKMAEEMIRRDERAKKELIEYAPILRKLSNGIPDEKKERLGEGIPESLDTMMAAVETISAAPRDQERDSEPSEPRQATIVQRTTRTASGQSAARPGSGNRDVLGECENSKFSFSVRPLLRGIFGLEAKFVPNPDFSKAEKLIDKQEFFLRLQSIFNNMVKSGVYQISDDDLKSIKESVWTGDFSKIRAKFSEVNSKLWIEGESALGSKITADGILSNLCAQAMGSNSYWTYSKDVDAAFSARMKDYNAATSRIRSARAAGKSPDPSDLEIESLLRASIEIIHEIVSVVSGRKFEALFKDLSWAPEKTKEAAVAKRQGLIASNVAFLDAKGWKYLDFDKEAKTVHIAIPYRSVFSNEFAKVVSYYRSKRTVSSIVVYLTN